ncbi:MAG: hypothetical protein M1501_00665 [Candidatus Omnitrophica bacterium]|nr:hypothetical protein [Candidatus Omnitrophota bacterium]
MKRIIMVFLTVIVLTAPGTYLKAQKLSNSEKQEIINKEWKQLMGQYHQAINNKKFQERIKQEGYKRTNKPVPESKGIQNPCPITKVILPEPVFLNKIMYINIGSAPLRIVLSELATQLGVPIITKSGVNPDMNVQGNFNGQTAKDVLDNLCNLLDYAWDVKKGKIYISKFGSEMFQLSVPYISTQFSNEIDLSANGITGYSAGASSPYNNMPDTTGTAGNTSTLNNNSSGNGNSGPNSFVRIYADKVSLYENINENLKSLISKDGKFAINNEAGTIFVFDRVRNLKRISEYFKTLNKTLSEELLVKAKVVEVTLNKGFQGGVNWNLLTSESGFQTDFNLLSSGPVFLLRSRQPTTTGTTTNGMEEIINLLGSQGKISILSEPQITVLNDQPAIIQMADIVSYIAQSSQYITQVGSQTAITPGEVMDGVNMTIIPKISKQGIFLNVMPSVTMVKQIQTINTGNGTEIQLPQVASRALNTSIRIKDGDIIAIGGLIFNQKDKEEQGIPVLSKIPVIGALFRQNTDTTSKDELLIFLTARRIKWSM